MAGADILFIINLAFIGLIFVLGFKPDAFRRTIGPGDLASYNAQTIKFEARVCEEAELSLYNRRLVLCASGRVLITTDLYPEYDYGDYLAVSGRLQAPPVLEGFDYDRYLARHDIYSLMYYPRLKLLDPVPEPFLRRAYAGLLKFKQAVRALINRSLPEPEAGLANALLLGYRRGLTKETHDMFARVGLSHIIAISGTHITILSALLVNFFLALGLNRRRVLALIIIFLFLYPILIGLTASAVRASLMGGLAFVAAYYQRLSSLHRALALAAAVMLAVNPLLLRADIGFQLSFLAILGIMHIYPWGDKLRHQIAALGRLQHSGRRILTAVFGAANLSLSVQLATWPIVLLNFHRLSLIAPVVNVLLVWTLPAILASLIGAALLAFILPGPDYFFFLPAYLLLKLVFSVSEYFAAFSWAALEIKNFPLFGAVIYYLALLGLLKVLNSKFKT